MLNWLQITCPGVWLCTNGFLEITIKCMGHFFKSSLFEPKFPVFCYQRFYIEGRLESVSCYHELHEILKTEKFEISLWQNGRRLAFYNGRINDILMRDNIEIIMTTNRSFPGIVGPKLQVSTKGFVSSSGVKESKALSDLNRDQQSSRQLYNHSRCSSSGLSEISNFSSEKKFMGHKNEKPACNHKKYHSIIKTNSAKNSFSPLNDDASSCTLLSLVSSEDNYLSIRKCQERRKIAIDKCEHNGIEGCEICIIYKRTFRSYN
ncbi:hypothetical protein ACFFRR_005585 [Megaselia abdita]